MDSWKPSSILTPWEPQTWVFNIMVIVFEHYAKWGYQAPSKRHMGESLPQIVPSTHEYEHIFPALYLIGLCTVLKLCQTHGLRSYCRLLLQIVRDLLLITNSPKNHSPLLLEHILSTGMVFSLACDSVFSIVLI